MNPPDILGGEPLDGSGFEDEEAVSITTDDGTVLHDGQLVTVRGKPVTSAEEPPPCEDQPAQ